MTYRKVLVGLCVLLSACTKGELTPACPNYGKYCHKQPINAWDYYDKATS